MKTDSKIITYIGHQCLDDKLGGAARLKTLLDILNNIGYEVNLVTYGFYSDRYYTEKKQIHDKLKVTTIYMPKKIPLFFKGLMVFIAFFYLIKDIKKSQVIMGNFRCIISSIPAIILKKIYNQPVVLDYTDIYEVIPELVYRSIAKNSDIIFAISPQLMEKLRKYGSKNSVYLPNFIDANNFKIDHYNRKLIREHFNITHSDILIGYVGSFWYVEGIPILLHAYNKLKTQYPFLKLGIIGEVQRSDDDNIPKIIEELELKDVFIIPLQPREEIPKYLSIFDIFCCPKIEDKINELIVPIKIIEYMSMGIPTIASHVGGIPDTITDGYDGVLVNPGNIDELSEKIEFLLMNMEMAQKIGENGRKTVIDRYSYDAIVNTVKNSLDNLIKL